jgi:hypothetical protein
MQQTFEYYVVDPKSWKDKERLTNVISSRITRDIETDTLESLTLDTSDVLGECYVRVYMIVIQNGIRTKIPLITSLVQTPSYGFDGKIRSVSLDAYSPLLEIKENQPPLGYAIIEESNIMDTAYKLIRENVRAPVVKTNDDKTLFHDFIANTDDTWISFVRDLISNANYTISLDEMGRILFKPQQDYNTLQPKWSFDDSNSSILYPDIDLTHDLYGIPNVVEVIFSSNKEYKTVKVVNDDKNSPTSTINRGREIVYRVTNPSVLSNPTEELLRIHGEQVLKQLSTLEYRVSYKHGYCPLNVGDCVRLNYKRAGLSNVKGKIVNQTIECIPGCPVTETVVFTDQLWRR